MQKQNSKRSLTACLSHFEAYIRANVYVIRTNGLFYAVVLEKLTGIAQEMEAVQGAKRRGWFRLPIEYFTEGLNMTEQTVVRIKDRLESKNIIESKTKKDGYYIRFNFEEYDKFLERCVFPPKRVRTKEPYVRAHTLYDLRTITRISKTNTHNTTSDHNIADMDQKQKDLSSFESMTNQLVSIRKNMFGLNSTTRQKGIWTRQFRLLHTADEISVDRIQLALDWYAKHGKDMYVPNVKAGEDFRRKFEKLEDAMRRIEQNNKKNKPTNLYRDGENKTTKGRTYKKV